MRRFVILACGLLAGCASAIRGTTEEVVVVVNPKDARITSTAGGGCPSSPCVLEVARKAKFTVYAEREGYKTAEVAVGTKMSGEGGVGLAGNILVGGIIGVGVDAATGAALDHYPNPVLMALEPLDAANPATPVQELPPAPPKPRPVLQKDPFDKSS